MNSESLTCACIDGNVPAVRAHLAAGVDAHVPDSEFWVPLVTAVSSERLEVAKLLLAAGADPRSGSRAWGSPLEAACSTGRLDMCELLLSYGAEVTDRHIETAAARGGVGMLHLLLQEKQTQPFVDFGNALFAAACAGNVEVVKELIRMGAEVDRPMLCSLKQATPLWIACKNRKCEAARMLFEAGANLRRAGFLGNLAADALQREQELGLELARWRSMPTALTEAIVNAAHASRRQSSLL